MDHRNCRRMLAVPLLAGAALVAAPSVDPQEVRLAAFPYFPKPAITLKAEARLVDIGVVVRDSQGHSVGGLTKSDFEIRDEGKRSGSRLFRCRASPRPGPVRRALRRLVALLQLPRHPPSPSRAGSRWCSTTWICRGMT
jgi:hypothetical protein